MFEFEIFGTILLGSLAPFGRIDLNNEARSAAAIVSAMMALRLGVPMSINFTTNFMQFRQEGCGHYACDPSAIAKWSFGLRGLVWGFIFVALLLVLSTTGARMAFPLSAQDFKYGDYIGRQGDRIGVTRAIYESIFLHRSAYYLQVAFGPGSSPSVDKNIISTANKFRRELSPNASIVVADSIGWPFRWIGGSVFRVGGSGAWICGNDSLYFGVTAAGGISSVVGYEVYIVPKRVKWEALLGNIVTYVIGWVVIYSLFVRLRPLCFKLISRESRCLVCGYSLVGLGSTHRCPECGTIIGPDSARPAK